MRVSSFIRTAVPPILVGLLVVLVWDELVRWREWPPFFVPSPLAVFQAASENAVSLAKATGVTALTALFGFSASLVFGTAIAFAFSQSRMIRTSCYPYAIFLQTVPVVAIAPIIIIWCGHGFKSVAIIAFIISLFPIITNATTGMLAVEPDLLDLFQLNRASRWEVWMKLRFPASVPHIMTGARISSGMAVIGAIVGEFFAGYGAKWHGLGKVILLTRDHLKTAHLFAAVIASTLLGLAIFGAMSVLSGTVLSRWYDHE